MSERRAVLVTGASRGIGKAVAVALAERGWRLILLARDQEALAAGAAELSGEGHRSLAMDVTDEQAWARAAPELGDVTGLVCAAGVLAPVGPIGAYEAAGFRRTLDVNVTGTMLAIRACLPALRRTRGAVVTFSGGGATSPLRRFDAYAASKAAVVRLTENVAVELEQDGVRVNSIAPGFVATEIHSATLEAGPALAGEDYFAHTSAELAGGGVPATEAAELACLMLEDDPVAPFTGRLVSAQWDDWRDPDFRRRLVSEPALGTLRRIDDVFFAANDVAGAAGATPVLSIVIPAYNEEENVERVYERLTGVLDPLAIEWEMIFSVDPCSDRTEELILGLRERDPRVKMLRFSRRFGQPMATLAGLDASSGEATIVIDCDLQDPPELIPELLARWREGNDVVYAQRRTRAGETIPKRIVAALGYRLIRRIADVEIPPNTGDFRLMSRRVVENVLSLKESHGFLRGLVGLVGFRQTSVLYDRDPRAAGSSKYNRFWGSLVIGLNGVVGFSRYPLQLISIAGVALSGLAFLVGIVYLGLKLGGQKFPVGNPTIVFAVAFFSGIQLLSLGVIGEYVGRIYDESRDRPKFIVESRHGWDEED